MLPKLPSFGDCNSCSSFSGAQLCQAKNVTKSRDNHTAAVALHGISILLVMIPSFGRFLNVVAVDVFSLGVVEVIMIFVHSVSGLLAEALGILLVSQWKFRPPSKWLVQNGAG